MPGDDARQALIGTRFFDVRWVLETGSTNADLLALAAEGAPDGVVLVADHQTAGRGRRDRTWEAPPDSSLLWSVLVRPQLDPSAIHLVTMAAALAASDACAEVAGVRPQLKWPNDLLVDEHKLAGILAESLIRGGEVPALVVGIGLNVNWPAELPPELAATATSLNHHAGHGIDREALLISFLRAFEEILPSLGTENGRGALLVRYRHRCATLGRQVRVELASEVIIGEAVDVDADGHLLIDLAGKLVPVAAGDVIHVRPAN